MAWNLELAGWLTWQQTQHLPPWIKHSLILQTQLSFYSKVLVCFLLQGTFIVPGHLVECDRFTPIMWARQPKMLHFNTFHLIATVQNFPSYFFQEPAWSDATCTTCTVLKPLGSSSNLAKTLSARLCSWMRTAFTATISTHLPFSDIMLKVIQQKYDTYLPKGSSNSGFTKANNKSPAPQI